MELNSDDTPAVPTSDASQPIEAPTAQLPAQSAPAPAGATQRYAIQQQEAQAAQPAATQSSRQDAGNRGGEARRPHAFARTALACVFGGLIGAGALAGTLFATGMIGRDSVIATTNSGQSITISASDDSASTATAVAVKSLPSVASIYCTYSDGEGMGSGVILDTDGNILTNHHVIAGATAITVTIDGKSYQATVVGTDSSSDLAVINAELDGDAVVPIEVGDSGSLRVGDWVMSIGSPFGLEQSVSQGIVSALYRNELMEGKDGNTIYANLIQVDASINPGNSGGALVDSQGRLVGICTLYSSDTESFAGIGFAIPGNYAIEVANEIISGKAVTHPYIGLGMQTVNAQTAQEHNLPVNQGAYVIEVYPGSPAEQAGIEVGDIVTAMDGEPISSADGLIIAVRSHRIGDRVSITVMRGDEEMTFDATLSSDEALQSRTTADGNGGLGGTSIGTEVVEELQRWYEQMQRQMWPVPLGGFVSTRGQGGLGPAASPSSARTA